MIGALGKRLLDWIYPPNIYCLNCGRPIDSRCRYSLCPVCVRRLNWANREVCQKCGRPLDATSVYRGVCHDCQAQLKPFNRGVACVGYGRAERDLLHRFKYHGQAWLAGPLGQLLAERIAVEQWNFDLIVPVPLHPKKLRRREYNQAELLAAELARVFDRPCLPDGLIRTVATEPMSRLTGIERRQHLKGVFAVAPHRAAALRDQRVLLVDDIYTTGSTAAECTAALLAAGVTLVNVAAFAAAADVHSLIDTDLTTGNEETVGDLGKADVKGYN